MTGFTSGYRSQRIAELREQIEDLTADISSNEAPDDFVMEREDLSAAQKELRALTPLANHDPAPWVSRRTGERYPEPDAAPETVLTWGMDYAPRPEYYVPDNPILTWLRILWPDPSPDTHESLVSAVLDDSLKGFTPEQIDHARRVLTHLATLTETETS